jgi:hypothetical protein
MVSQIVASKLSGLVYTAENERFVSVTEKPQHPLQKIRLKYDDNAHLAVFMLL